MATRKTATAKKAPAKKKSTPRKRYVNVLLQKPMSMPETLKVEKGTTIDDLITSLNLEGYIVRVNSQDVSDNYELEKDDVIRVGVKTKQG